MVVELGTVVECERLQDATIELLEHGQDTFNDLAGTLASDLANQREAALTFHCSDQVATGCPARHQVELPVANATPRIDDRWTGVNRGSVLDRS